MGLSLGVRALRLGLPSSRASPNTEVGFLPTGPSTLNEELSYRNTAVSLFLSVPANPGHAESLGQPAGPCASLSSR